MTGSSSCPRLLPLLACRSPCQPYNAVGSRWLLAHSFAFASLRRRPFASRAYARDDVLVQQRSSLSGLSGLSCRRLSRHAVSCLGGTQSRGKKTKSSVKLADLPQGLLRAEPLPELEDESGPAYPTVVLQARRNMRKFENCVLLTRVGGFYELYFEHAEEYGPLLNLKVARKKTSAGPVPMVP